MTKPMMGGKSGWGRAFTKNRVAILALLCVTIAVRIPAISGHPLWNDELWRAVLILDPQFWHYVLFSPTVETAITSPIYALLVKFLGLVWISPVLLRLSSLLPGVVCAMAAFALIRKIGGRTGLALLAGFVFALNPVFISYSNELKPYMLELCTHLACLYVWLTLVMARPPTARQWASCFAVLTLGLFSTSTVIFVLPATGVSLFVRYLIDRDTKSLAICVTGFAGLALVTLALYYFIWRYGTSGGMLTVWANGFLPPGGNYFHFLTSQFSAMWRTAFNTLVIVPWQPTLAMGTFVVSLACLTAIGAIARQPVRDLLLFYLVLLGTLCGINYLRLWPLDGNRENIFLFGHIIVFLFMMVAQIPLPRLAGRFLLICAVPVLLWPARHADGRAQYRALAAGLANMGAPVERGDLVVEDFSYSGRIGKTIAAGCSKHKTVIVQDGFIAMATNYYTRFDSAPRDGAALLNGNCVELVSDGEAYQDPDKTAAVLARALSKAPEAWLLYAHLGKPEVAALREVAQHFGRISQSREYERAGYFKLVTSRSRD